MVIRSENTVNTDALRMIPYAMLVKALVSLFTMISIGTACLGVAGRAGHEKDVFISICLLGILAVLGCTLAIYCLCGLQDLSDKFRATLILLVIIVIVCCMGILLRAEGIYQRAYGQQQAFIFIECANNIAYIIEKIVTAIALLIFMKGLADVLNKKEGNSILARSIETLGAIYSASVIILHIVISIAYAKEISNGTYFLLLSLLIWTLLEIAIFFLQRKATIIIWQDHNERICAKQIALKEGRG